MKKILIIILIISFLFLFYFTYSHVRIGDRRPEEKIHKSLVFENDTVQIFHYQRYKLIGIGADTVYKKKRVRSTLEYQTK